MSKNSNDLRVTSIYKKRRIVIVAIFLCLSLTSFFLGITFGINYIDKKNKFMFSVQEIAQQKILTTADTISTFIKTLKNSTLSLVSELEKNTLSKKAVENFLDQKPVEVSNFGVKFTSEFSPTGKYWAPCISLEGRKNKLEDFSHTFTGAINSEIDWDHERLVHDTFSTDIDDDILVEYRHVFYHKNLKTGTRVPAGIVFANQNRKYFRHLLTTLFYGQAGYWFIVEKNKGTVLIHPKKHYEDNKITLFQLAEQRNAPELKALYERVQSEKVGYFKYNNEITGSSSWLYFRSIPQTDWILCGVFDRSDVLLPPKQEKRDIIHLFLFFFCFILFLVGAFIFNNTVTIRKLWLIAIVFSIGLTMMLGLIWYVTMAYPIIQETGSLIRDKIDLYKKFEEFRVKGSSYLSTSTEGKNTTLISSDDNAEILPEKLLHYLTFHYHAENSSERDGNSDRSGNFEYWVIPTGIFINHMNYINRNQLEMGFFLWQRYIKVIHGSIKHDILLPKAAGAETKVLYRREVDGVEIILWEVKCVLDQLADFTNYPFDINAIRLKIWPNEFDKKIILVPDFNSYNTVNPSFLPGLANKMFLVGFNPVKSFFSFREGTYNTNFGIYNYGKFGVYEQLDKAKIPELYFNIIPQRQVLDIIITDLAPLIIIVFFIFYLFMMIGSHSYTMFGSSATVFFGLLLAHMRFRSKLPSTQFVYFDCFYIVLYAMILLFTVASIFNVFYTKDGQLSEDHHKRNLILQLLYWPLVLGSLLFCTFLYLY